MVRSVEALVVESKLGLVEKYDFAAVEQPRRLGNDLPKDGERDSDPNFLVRVGFSNSRGTFCPSM